MNKIWITRSLPMLLAGLFAASTSWADSEYTPTEAEANKYSLETAKNNVRRGLEGCIDSLNDKVQIMPDIIVESWPGGVIIWGLRDLHDIKSSFDSNAFTTRPRNLRISANGSFFTKKSGKASSLFEDCHDLNETWVQGLADGLLRLKLEYDKANSPEVEAKFKEDAARYQAADPKPELPEDARRFRVQAEKAVADKRFLDAIDKYGKALEIAPWWPEAHFNRAVVLAELQNFDSAMVEMKRYLLLKPDAPDARQAKDFIYTWEDHPYSVK
jgi:tetratricopeptide (TPR) repeat protein